MGAKYSSQTISGYNQSPPADDGTQTESNRVKYATIKTKITDPVKTALESINTALVDAFNYGPNTQSGAYATLAADHDKTIQLTGSGNITLLAAATGGAGYTVTVSNQHSAANNVIRSGSDTINGSVTTWPVSPGCAVRFVVNAAANGYLAFPYVQSLDGITIPAVLTYSGLQTFSAGITLSGTASNLALGSNYISNGGTDAGLSVDGSNNFTMSAGLSVVGQGNFGAAGATWDLFDTGILGVGNAAFASYQTSQLSIVQNTYYNAGWKYKNNGFAAHIQIASGGFDFQTAGSGTAGNAISWSTPLSIAPTTGTVAVASALTVGTTLGVTGTSTLAAVNASGVMTVSNVFNATVTDAGVGTKTVVANFTRNGAATSTTSRELGFLFSDASGLNTVAGITGVRPNSNADFTGGLKLWVNPGTNTSTFADLVTGIEIASTRAVTIPGTLDIGGTTINMVASGTTLTVGVGADNGTVSAGVFTDRTKYYEGDALAELALVTGKDGEIDHDTLPAFARATVKRPIMADVEKDVERKVKGKKVIEKQTVREQVGEEDAVERDLGACISMLMVAVQQLTARVAALEKK